MHQSFYFKDENHKMTLPLQAKILLANTFRPWMYLIPVVAWVLKLEFQKLLTFFCACSEVGN